MAKERRRTRRRRRAQPDDPPPMGAGGATDTDLLADDRHRRADARMVMRALRRGWPISDDLKATLVERVAKVVGDDSVSPRELSSMGHLLTDMERQNIDAERLQLAKESAGGGSDDVPPVLRTHTGGPGGVPPEPRQVDKQPPEPQPQPKPQPKPKPKPQPKPKPKAKAKAKAKPGGSVFRGE